MINKPIYSIAERLRELLIRTGDSQTEMGKKTGLNRADVSRYVNGARIPRQDKIGIIAEVYGIEPSWIMGYDVPMYKAPSAPQADEDMELLSKWHCLNDLQRQIIKMTIDNFLGLLPLPEVRK